MSDDPYAAVDAGASYMGKFGLKNWLVCWLIERGHGEIVALRSEEIERGVGSPPKCWRCKETMVFRPDCWACYRHQPALKIRHRLQGQPVPKTGPRIEEALGQIVDYQYRFNPATGRTEWQWVTEDFTRVEGRPIQ